MTLRYAFFLVLVTLQVAVAGEWKPQRVIILPFQGRTTPATGETEAWMVKAVAPVGRRFLVLVEHQRNRLSPWVDDQSLKEDIKRQGVVGQDKVLGARFHDELLLMLVNNNGRVVVQSSPHPEIKHWSGFFHNTRAVPLIMEEGDTCQYALLEPRAKKLFCFDLQLSFQRTLDIPLDIPMRPGVTREGNDYYLFFFGWKLAQARRISSWEKVFEVVPEKAESLGVLWKVGERSTLPLAVSPHQLWWKLDRLARGPSGEKLPLQQAGVAMHPVQRVVPKDSLDVLITAVSAGDFQRYLRFEGFRVFFLATLTRNGLGKVMQLPFWVVQEKERTSPEMDA